METHTLLMSLILFLYSFTRSLGDVINNGPLTMEVQPGQTAYFSCSVSCAYNIQWRVEDYRGDITSMCMSTSSSEMICTSILQDCDSTSTSWRVGQLRIRTNNKLAGRSLAVQCTAEIIRSDTVSNCTPSDVFSRFAFLHVNETAPEPTPEPTPVMSPTPPQETVTETVTVTRTVTTTEVITVTSTPTCNPSVGINGASGVRRLQLSSILRELFTWLCTLLTGLALL